jgi:hypothetical protein
MIDFLKRIWYFGLRTALLPYFHPDWCRIEEFGKLEGKSYGQSKT